MVRWGHLGAWGCGVPGGPRRPCSAAREPGGARVAVVPCKQRRAVAGPGFKAWASRPREREREHGQLWRVGAVDARAWGRRGGGVPDWQRPAGGGDAS